MLATSRRSTTRRAAVALLVWAGLWLASLTVATPVDAHATLLRSDPTTDRSYTSGPQSITLWFSEQIETEYSRIDVLRRDGSRVLAGEVEALNDGPDPALRLPLSEPLSDGSYTVVWSTLSAVDSHVSEGYFSFAVGDVILPSPSEEAELAASAASDKVIPQFVDAAIRWLSLLGQASIAGVLLFAPIVLMPVLRDGEGRRLPIPAGRFRRLLFASLALLVVGHLAAAVIQIMNATRSAELSVLGDPLISLLSGTRYGALWLSRSVLIVALAVLLWLLTRGRRLMTTASQGRVVWIWAGWIAALVLLTTSLGSHAAARGGAQSLPVALDWLHLVGTAVWTGGIFALILSLPLAAAASATTRRRLIQRFSVVALIAFAVLAITGTIAAIREVNSIDGLTSTDYGFWFVAKLVVVAGAVGFGAWHWLVVRPALSSGQESVVAQAARGFRRTLPVEAGLVILAVAATGLLTSSIPARDLLNTGPPTFGTTRLMSEASITLRATPGEVGSNEFTVVVGPVDADTFGDLESIDLRFEPAGSSDSSQQIQLEQASPNDPWTYRGNGNLLSQAGDWQVTAIIRRVGDATELEAPFALTADSSGLRPTGVPAPVSDDGLNSEALVLASAWLLGALTLATAAFLMRRRERTTLSFSLLTLSVLAAAMGSVLLLAGGIVA